MIQDIIVLVIAKDLSFRACNLLIPYYNRLSRSVISASVIV